MPKPPRATIPNFLAMILVSWLVVAGCGNDPSLDQDVSSEPVDLVLDQARTILQGAPGAGPNLGPAFFVAELVGGNIPDLEALLTTASLRQTRFSGERPLAFVVFQGAYPTDGHDFQPNRFFRQGDEFFLEVSQLWPPGNAVADQAPTQPALIVPFPATGTGSFRGNLALERTIGDLTVDEYFLAGQTTFQVGSVDSP